MIIETKEAAENLDAIAAMPGVDVLLFAMFDLCLSLGLNPFEMPFPETEAILEQALETTGRCITLILNAQQFHLQGCDSKVPTLPLRHRFVQRWHKLRGEQLQITQPTRLVVPVEAHQDQVAKGAALFYQREQSCQRVIHVAGDNLLGQPELHIAVRIRHVEVTLQNVPTEAPVQDAGDVLEVLSH